MHTADIMTNETDSMGLGLGLTDTTWKLTWIRKEAAIDKSDRHLTSNLLMHVQQSKVNALNERAFNLIAYRLCPRTECRS